MKRFLTILLAVCLLLGITACAAKRPDGTVEYDYTETSEKLEYTIWASGLQLYSSNTGDRVIKHLEDKFNIKLNVAGASANWRDKLVNLVSDYKNVPDLFFCVPSESYFVDWVKKEVVWPLNGYIDRADATTLATMFDSNQFKDSTTIDGTNYFVPASTGYTNHSLMVRKDWMNKWNASRGASADSYPKTVSEFTEMLTYFRNDDPDGDGRKNTYGLALSNNFDFTQDLQASFGVSANFEVASDGSYSLSAMSARYDDYLDWLKAGNSSGYIYPSFYALSEDECRLAFLQGKAGACITNGDRFFDGLYTEFRTVDADNYMNMLDVIPYPSSDDGKYKGGAVGYQFFWGGWCISQTAKEPMRLVKLMDYLMSEEGQKLLVYGVKDIHYTEANGVITPNLTERYADAVNAFYYSDVHDNKSPDGRWGIGEVILPSPFKIVNKDIVVNMPCDTYFNDGKIVEKYYDIQAEQGVNMRQPTFLLDDVDIMDSWNKVIDYAKTYTINVVAGKSRTDQFNEMKRLCNNAGLSNLLAYMKNRTV